LMLGGSDVTLRDFDLEESNVIEILVKDDRTGEPVANARILSTSEPPHTEAPAEGTPRLRAVDAARYQIQLNREMIEWTQTPRVTDAAGRVRMPLEPTTVALTLHHRAYQTVRQPVSPSVHTLTITLSRGAEISGTVKNGAGEPERRAVVVVVDEDQVRSVFPDEQGRYVVSGLSAGDYTVALVRDRAMEVRGMAERSDPQARMRIKMMPHAAERTVHVEVGAAATADFVLDP
jgi:hypothetical protein